MKRWAWFLLGWVNIGLAIIGALLPVMPTTIFLILAAGCFSRSSPRFEAWLLNHRWMGPPIRNWRASGAIPTKAKIIAITSMAGGFAIMQFTAHPPLWVSAIVAIVLIGCATFVATRPA